jgi:HAMP domain-containing protein
MNSNCFFILEEMQPTHFRQMLFAIFVAWVALSSPQGGLAQAQRQIVKGSLSGEVTDASGAVVRNAEIKATNMATGQTWTVASGSSGEFQLPDLPPGSYAVEVSASGFQVFRVSKISVAGGAVYRLPVMLVVESAHKVVIRKGGAADDYKPTSISLGNLTNEPILELPMSALVVTRLLYLSRLNRPARLASRSPRTRGQSSNHSRSPSKTLCPRIESRLMA